MNLILSLLLLFPAPLPSFRAHVDPAGLAAESADELIAAGRTLLAEGKAGEALGRFEAAEKLDGSLRTRQWVLRAWIAQGRVNDVLNETDALSKGGAKGATIDYLYGMAFSQKAKGYIVEGVNGGIVGMAFGDAVEFLKKATDAEPVLYSDAFLPLAESAWYAQQLDLARAAADKATELRPNDGATWHMLGQVAFAQFSAARAEPASAAEADAAWKTAFDAFTKAAALCPTSADAAVRAQGTDAVVQLAWLHVWKQQGDEAAQQFAAAIALDPTAVDMSQLRDNLTPEQFVRALEEASKQYAAKHGEATTADALLLWWLGCAQYSAKSYPEAEAAFTRAVAKNPEYVNSWYYIALSRYFRQDYDGAIAALRTEHGLSPDETTASLRANQAENLRILDYMIGMKAGRAANLDAAFLSELQARMVPDNDRYWNNLGLFLRDEAETRERRKKQVTPEEKAQIMDLYERSYAAYAQSLELSPKDPNYLNDTALMLHYHLDRDLDQARAWYVLAAQMAEVELARTDIDKETRALREVALRDAKNNLADLDRLLEQRRKDAEKAKAEAEKPPAPPDTPPKPQ
jgi:tetratricopeptide (TPR) repeat protein